MISLWLPPFRSCKLMQTTLNHHICIYIYIICTIICMFIYTYHMFRYVTCTRILCLHVCSCMYFTYVFIGLELWLWWNYVLLHHSMWYHMILHCTILYYIKYIMLFVLYRNVVLYCIILYYVLYCIILYYIVLYCIVMS